MAEPTYIETAKEVAGKAIGKHGLIYITIIVVVGVGASIILEEFQSRLEEMSDDIEALLEE